MRRTAPLAVCLLAACLTVLGGCGRGGDDAVPREVADSTSAPAPVAEVGDTVAFTDQEGRTAGVTLDGVRRTDRADSSQLIAEVTVTVADSVVSADPLRFRAQTARGALDPGDGVTGRPVEDGIALDVPEGEVLISYVDPDGAVLVAFRIEAASQAPADDVDHPPFSCDMGVDGIPVCEGDVPDSVGVHRTPEGALVGG